MTFNRLLLLTYLEKSKWYPRRSSIPATSTTRLSSQTPARRGEWIDMGVYGVRMALSTSSPARDASRICLGLPGKSDATFQYPI
jgi:hypothetical protein